MTLSPRLRKRRNGMRSIAVQVLKVAAAAALTYIAEELLSAIQPPTLGSEP
jgi:hypothetical protein